MIRRNKTALKNENLNGEIWAIIHQRHWVIMKLAERLGMPDTNFYRILKREHVSSKLIEIMEVLCYDVEDKFIPRKKQ